MAGPDRPHYGWMVGVAVCGLAVAGCGSSGAKPLDAPAGTTESVPPPTNSAPAPVVVEQEAADTRQVPEPVVEEAPPSEPKPELVEQEAADIRQVPEPVTEEPLTSEPEGDNESLVLIDTGARDVTEQPQTLVEAARAERQRRNLAEPTGIVITDQTLDEYATGQLTMASPSNPNEADAAAVEVLREMEEKEAYWRGRAREIRQAWRDAYDRIPELEEKVFELRQAFFREDDGFYRDAEIKPAWDRAIEQLEEAHRQVEVRQQELAEFLEEGRAAGALPGWLREGIDLEPQPRTEEDTIAEPGEPIIYEPEASDPP